MNKNKISEFQIKLEKTKEDLTRIGEFLLSIPPRVLTDKGIKKRFGWLVSIINEVDRTTKVCEKSKILFIDLEEKK